VPSITVNFEVSNIEETDSTENKKRIGIFIGSDALRMHSADVLFSSNSMILYGDDRERLSVPFVRPEDDRAFKFLSTTHVVPNEPRLDPTAEEFVSSAPKTQKPAIHDPTDQVPSLSQTDGPGLRDPLSRTASPSGHSGKVTATSSNSENGAEIEKQARERTRAEVPSKETAPLAEDSRREPTSAILGPWRQGLSANSTDNGHRENGLLSGYQPAGRGPRSMKVLKATKSGSSSSARTGAAYEPAPPPRSSSEHRRKGQVGSWTAGENGISTSGNSAVRWDSRRSSSSKNGGVAGSEGRSQGPPFQDAAKPPSVPRSANNPLGGASAFAWMGQSGKQKTTAAASE
jgi:hypothetical protein